MKSRDLKFVGEMPVKKALRILSIYQEMLQDDCNPEIYVQVSLDVKVVGPVRTSSQMRK